VLASLLFLSPATFYESRRKRDKALWQFDDHSSYVFFSSVKKSEVFPTIADEQPFAFRFRMAANRRTLAYLLPVNGATVHPHLGPFENDFGRECGCKPDSLPKIPRFAKKDRVLDLFHVITSLFIPV